MSEIDDWLKYKAQTARSTSGNSTRARAADLTAWAKHLGHKEGQLNVRKLNVPEVLDAVEAMRATHAESTVQRRLTTLRTFSRWCAQTAITDNDPLLLLDVAARPTPKGDVKAFKLSEIERTFEKAESVTSRVANLTRDVAMLKVLVGTGVRAEELCQLRVRDIGTDLERPLLRVVLGTKSGDARSVPIPRETMAALESHLDGYVGETLFVRNNGQPFTYNPLQYLVSLYLKAAQVVPPTGAIVHAFRHTFGSELARRGVPAPIIQQLLGHSDVRVSAVYTRIHSENLVAALDDAGWL